MRLDVAQRFPDHPVSAVAAAWRDPELYRSFTALPFVGTPEVLDANPDGEAVVLAIRYDVDLDLPSAARAFVDPDRLSFVEHSRIEADGSSTFRVKPDHYPKLLRFEGTTEIGSDPTVRRTIGDLRVDLGWKGMVFVGVVESAIKGGFEQALQAQVGQVERFLDAAG